MWYIVHTFVRRHKILLIGDNVLHKSALFRLQRLDFEENIQLAVLPPDFRDAASMDAVLAADALICRPTNGRIPGLLLQKVERPLLIATVSMGKEHIEHGSNKNIKVISPRITNADAVAEVTISLALSTRRRLEQAARTVQAGLFSKAVCRGCNTLRGLTWLLLGKGAQAASVVRRLGPWGLRTFAVWHPEMTPALLKEFVERAWRVPTISSNDGFELRAKPCYGAEILVQGCSDWRQTIRNADIVSLHLELTQQAEGNRPATAEMVNPDFLSLMKEGAVLINASRGGLVVEEAILSALDAGHLGGYGTDVLNAEAENLAAVANNTHLGGQAVNVPSPEDDYEPARAKSPLWSRLFSETRSNGARGLNLVITPHVGGNAEDADDELSNDVLDQLLVELGVQTSTPAESTNANVPSSTYPASSQGPSPS